MEIPTKVLKLLNKLKLRQIPKPPYSHIVQLGDPVLRSKCSKVERDRLLDPDFQKLLFKMENVLKRYKCVGVAAPQVGVDLRVFAMRCPRVEDFHGSPEEYQIKEMKFYPYSVWINPTMKVLDYTKITFNEGCESMRGYVAEVPRFSRVQLTGWDENGAEKSEELSGWLARIAQHEMDHLNGRMYIDIAHLPSLVCAFWDRVNTTGGQIHVSYYPNKILSKG